MSGRADMLAVKHESRTRGGPPARAVLVALQLEGPASTAERPQTQGGFSTRYSRSTRTSSGVSSLLRCWGTVWPIVGNST